MAASAYLKFSGYYHLVYQSVQAFVGGLDCGDYTVDTTGSIIVPFGSDSGGLMTPTYLASLSPYSGENAMVVNFDLGLGQGVLSYTVPVVIGAGYTSQGQTLRPATADDLKSPSGPALGKMRRAYQFSALLLNCITNKMSFGSDLSGTLQSATFRTVYTDPSTDLSELSPFSGVYWSDVISNSDFDNAIAWQVTRPVPATVCALTSFIEGQER